MATMVARVFIDTNIVLRALLMQADLHREADAFLKQLLQDDTELWINGQIIREFIVQATHPKTFKTPLSMEETLNEVATIKKVFRIADETAAVREKLLELLEIYPVQGKQVHDTNLVATMLSHNIETLVTLNIPDFARFKDQIKVLTVP
jgi:predicted nucleic acid-binding protein